MIDIIVRPGPDIGAAMTTQTTPLRTIAAPRLWQLLQKLYPGIVLAMVFSLLGGGACRAEADGPDYWQVSGVASNDQLMVHKEPSARSAVIGRLAHDAVGLRNLGCKGVPSFREWQKMTPSQRTRSAHGRWCRIQANGLEGWVAGRFLAEGAPNHAGGRSVGPMRFGDWTVKCQGKDCVIEQAGVAAHRPTTLRLARVASNWRIDLVRANPPRSGTLSIYADGELLSGGPISRLTRKDNARLVMEPDDVTAGLVKQMRRHKNMVVSFPGEERGVEFHVDKLDAAIDAMERHLSGSE